MTHTAVRRPDAPGEAPSPRMTPGASESFGAPASGTPQQGSSSTGTSANEAWESLLTAHATLMRRFAAADIWREVSMREYDVLYTLAKCPGPTRQSELERHVLLSQPAISRLVDRLVSRGLVAKTADPADRRGVLLALTDEGRAVQRQVGARHARDVAHLVGSRLASTELAELRRLTARLAGAGAPEH